MSLLKQREEIDEKYRNQAGNLKKNATEVKNCPKKFPKTRPKFAYPSSACLQDIAVSIMYIIKILVFVK